MGIHVGYDYGSVWLCRIVDVDPPGARRHLALQLGLMISYLRALAGKKVDSGAPYCASPAKVSSTPIFFEGALSGLHRTPKGTST